MANFGEELTSKVEEICNRNAIRRKLSYIFCVCVSPVFDCSSWKRLSSRDFRNDQGEEKNPKRKSPNIMSLFIQPRRKIQGLDHLFFREEMMYIILILKEDEKRVNREKTNQGP